MLACVAVVIIALSCLACGSSEADNAATPTATEQSSTKPIVIIPSPLEAPPFRATTFLSDVVIPSKRGIGLVGWSLDSQRLAYASIDPSLNVPPDTEGLYSSDLTGTVIVDEGLVAMPSFVPPDGFNPQRSAAAAWTRNGLIKETGAPGSYGVVSTEPNAATIPSLALCSIPVDREGRAYLLGADGSWQRDDESVIAQLTNPIDEGAFSVSPDGTYATYARDRADGQRDLILADTAGSERVVATAPFIAVDGWKADSSALALRTGINPKSSWRTDVAWFVLDTSQSLPVAPELELDGLFLSIVLPSPTDAQTYLVAGTVIGTDVASLDAWYLTTDAGASFSRFGLGAAGSAAWSPDGAAIAYTTAKVDDRGTGIMRLHIARLR